jgi:hypothetical protein
MHQGVLSMDTALKLLQDPVWQFIGVLIAIIGISVTIVIFFNQRSNKKIAFSVISDAQVASIEKGVEDIGGEVEVYYKTKDDSKLIKDAHLLIIDLWNAGNKEIKREDFEDKIRFEFGSDANILTKTILDTTPQDVKGTVFPEIEKNVLLLKPLLLNKGDKVRIKVLADGYQAGSLKAYSRISGVKQMEEVVKRENTASDENPSFFTGCGIFWFILFVGFTIIYFIISGINAIFSMKINLDSLSKNTIFSFAILGFSLLLTLIIVSFMKYRYKRKDAIKR